MIILVPGSAWNPKLWRLLPPEHLHLLHNEADSPSNGIPGQTWNEEKISFGKALVNFFLPFYYATLSTHGDPREV